jgi:twitching motility protein PilT
MIQYNLSQLLKTLVDENGSDLHLTAGSPPRLRASSKLVPLQVPPLTPEDCLKLLEGILTPDQIKHLQKEREIDLAFSVVNLARFRGNIFYQRGTLTAVFRVISQKVHTIDELGLPGIFKTLCEMRKGLILITGPTGSGKTTSMAAMINHINENKSDHIVTIEDPIEYVHKHKMCIINQREIGDDTKSFPTALKSVLRQDPDVVMIGGMRDHETVAAALTTSETGHLVITTLHTNGCVHTLNRIIDVFPPHQQGQIRTQLAMNLNAVISQQLIPDLKGGVSLACEIMLSTPATRALIADHKFNQIYSYMQSGRDGSGMQTMNQALLQLVTSKRVSPQAALEESSDQEELEKMFEKNSIKFTKQSRSA